MPTLQDQIAGIGPRTHVDIVLADLINRPQRAIDARAIGSVIESKRVLITGAGGSIGGELARICANYAPAELILVDRSENALFDIDRQIARLVPSLVRRARLHDVVHVEQTIALFESARPEIVFHAAAHKHVPMMEDHPSHAVDNNLFGTKSVADAADACRVERFVMISTDKAVNPASIMGATKRLAELYVQDINRRSTTAFSMVRFGNVLGSSGSVLETWSRQIADGGPLTVTHAEMTRYFMTIPEAAVLVIQSAALVDPANPDGEVFVLNMGGPIRVLDLARRFIQQHGLTPAIGSGAGQGSSCDVGIVLTGPRPGEKLHEELACDAQSLLDTRHPDIHVWMLPAPNPNEVQEMIQRLSPLRRSDDPKAVARIIRELIPEMRQPVAA